MSDDELLGAIPRGGVRWDQPGADARADLLNTVGRMAHASRNRHLPDHLFPCILGVGGCVVQHGPLPAPLVASGGWCAPVVDPAYDIWSVEQWRTRDRPWSAHVDVDRWLFPRSARAAARVGEYRYRVRASGRLARQAFRMLVRPLDHGDDPEGDE
jgi:hypothetical protein